MDHHPTPGQALAARDLRVRKNVKALSASERTDFVSALLELKQRGRYDDYIRWHHHSMMTACPMPGENPHWRFRNAAHRGPVFLPWHRDYILCLENDLREQLPDFTLPYWDWTEDAELVDPTSSELWSADFLGGGGIAELGFDVLSGPFAPAGKKWLLPEDIAKLNSGTGLKRGFGKFRDPFGVLIDSLPTKADVNILWEEVLYDTAPWNSSASTIGFRNRLEGWVTSAGDHRVRREGVQLHNRVHVWIGGSMARPVSPVDPVFFLHHCFVDKLWTEWLAKTRQFYQALEHDGGHGHAPLTLTPGYYLPVKDGPAMHNLYDAMYPPPWEPQRVAQPLDFLEHHQLGYRYDTEPAVLPHQPHHLRAVLAEQELRAFTA